MTLEKSVNDFAVEEHLPESERIALITYVRRLRADGYRVVKLVAFDGTSRWRNEAVVVDEELT